MTTKMFQLDCKTNLLKHKSIAHAHLALRSSAMIKIAGQSVAVASVPAVGGPGISGYTA